MEQNIFGITPLSFTFMTKTGPCFTYTQDEEDDQKIGVQDS